MRNSDRGLFVVLVDYGRGIDFKLSVDSKVYIVDLMNKFTLSQCR